MLPRCGAMVRKSDGDVHSSSANDKIPSHGNRKALLSSNQTIRLDFLTFYLSSNLVYRIVVIIIVVEFCKYAWCARADSSLSLIPITWIHASSHELLNTSGKIFRSSCKLLIWYLLAG